MFFFVLHLFTFTAQAQDLREYFALPATHQWLVEFDYAESKNEMEYEVNAQVLEERNERRKTFTTSLKHALDDKNIVGLKVPVGTFRADHAYNTPALDNYDYPISGKGFNLPYFDYFYVLSPRENYSRRIYVGMQPLLPNQDEDDYHDSRFILELKYIFTFSFETAQSNISLETIYFGRKKSSGNDNTYETIEDDHSEFRVYANHLHSFFQKWQIGPELSFGLTTNYNIRNNRTPKQADKGFKTLYGIMTSYLITPNHLIGLNVNKGSDVYNPQNQPNHLNIDYEFEHEQWILRYKYTW